MSEPKFTPGPWYLDYEDEIMDISIWSKGKKDENGEDTIIMNIGEVCMVCGDISEEDIANANLISAAPDMYEALKEACLDCDCSNNKLCEGCHINKALRRARGR